MRSSSHTDSTSVNINLKPANRGIERSRGKTPKSDAKPSPSDPHQTRPLVVSVETAVNLLDDNRDGIYKLLAEKKLLSYLDGRRRKIFVSSIDALIRERYEAALKEPFERHRYPTPKRAGDK